MNLVKALGKVVATKRGAESVVDTVIGAISKALKKEDRVTLVGFGTFSVIKRPARKGRNPQIGKEFKIAAKKVPKFTPGKGLKALAR